MVVATPERVAFAYETAGLGSRFVAQLIDVLLLAGLLLAITLLGIGIGMLTDSRAGLLFVLLIGFAVLWGYFMVGEAVWSGQTLGKRLLRLRVVGVSGEPISAMQAIIRNLVRLVDFLPSYYLVGVIVMFVTQRSQRLGDLAAGTMVVKERGAVSLRQLLARTAEAQAPTTPTPAPTPPAAAAARHWGARLPPDLRRFVAAYAQRRTVLPEERRRQLAESVEVALIEVMPDIVLTRGSLAALDLLADEQLTQ